VRWCVDRVFCRESSFVYWRERFRCHNHKWKNSILSEFFWYWHTYVSTNSIRRLPALPMLRDLMNAVNQTIL
jgi:hypothetical protein